MANPSFVTAFRSMVCAAIVLLSAASVAPAPLPQRVRRFPRRTVERSPDGALVATAIYLRPRIFYADPPSRVEIRRANGRRVARRDHSGYPDQGYTVQKAAWTADSRFFVYRVSNSGGHSPWHHPIFFYSRRRHRFYCLDDVLGTLGPGSGTVTGDMQLRSPCTVVTKARYYGKSLRGLRTSIEEGDTSGEQVLVIDLRWLESRLR